MPKGRIQLRLTQDALEMLDELAKGPLRTRTEAIEMAIRLLWSIPEQQRDPNSEIIRKTPASPDLLPACKPVDSQPDTKLAGSAERIGIPIPGVLYTLSCPECGHLWRSEEGFPTNCPNCGAARETGRVVPKNAPVGPTVESGRGKASVETVKLPLKRDKIVPIPKPSQRKGNK